MIDTDISVPENYSQLQLISELLRQYLLMIKYCENRYVMSDEVWWYNYQEKLAKKIQKEMENQTCL